MSASPLDNDERFQNTVACTKFMMSMLASGEIGRGQTPVVEVQLMAIRTLKQSFQPRRPAVAFQ